MYLYKITFYDILSSILISVRNNVIISIIKKLFSSSHKRNAKALSKAVKIARHEHCISQADISDHALKVIKRLTEAGHSAYLVGGSVRDLLLHRAPKDFDVATDATPEAVRKLFRNCRLIGRRFRLAHILFGREIVEVATYRAEHTHSSNHARKKQGMIVRDNIFGAIDEDAWRRDFTINALYYDVHEHCVLDFTSGFVDLEQKLLRLIGDPKTRYHEDPVRILRAIRFSVKLGLTIEQSTAEQLRNSIELLNLVPPARLFDEVLKIYHSGNAQAMQPALEHYGVFNILFPVVNSIENTKFATLAKPFIQTTLSNTDKRISEGKPITPAFLFATILWHPVQLAMEQLENQHLSPAQRLLHAMRQVIREQNKRIHIPRRFTLVMQEIWLLQYRLHKRGGYRAFRLLNCPRFRAGYDFLLLRAKIGEEDQALADWWTKFQEVDEDQQQAMVKALHAPRKARKKKQDQSND